MAAVAQSFANDASSAHNIEVAAQAVQSYTPLLCATARAVAVEKVSIILNTVGIDKDSSCFKYKPTR